MKTTRRDMQKSRDRQAQKRKERERERRNERDRGRLRNLRGGESSLESPKRERLKYLTSKYIKFKKQFQLKVHEV